MSLFSKRKIVPSAEITPDILAFWRRTYANEIFEFNENGKVGYFRKLSVKELDKELRIFERLPVVESEKYCHACKFSLRLIELSMLGGDVEIMNTEPYTALALNQVGDFVLQNINDTLPNLKVK